MAGMEDLLKKFIDSVTNQKANWVNVAKLKGPDLMRYKKERMELRKKGDEIKMHIASLESLQAQCNEMNMALWNHIYKEYDLPSSEIYEIEKDGTVRKRISGETPANDD